MLHLAKYHATGNDFLVWSGPVDAELDRDVVQSLCDRRRGVGADGLITLGPPQTDGAHCSFRLHNADGSDAEMSGNGMRCLAAAAAAHGLGTATRLVVDTVVGVRTVGLRRDGADLVISAAVDLGTPTVVPAEIPLACPSNEHVAVTIDGVHYDGDAIGMGNPHWVLFVDDVEGARLDAHGRALECDPRFPNRTNVEFVRVSGPDRITMRVWERGVGETMSCGTGATAAAVAAHRRGLVGPTVTVEVPGGALEVRIGATAVLDGPVVHVADIEVPGVDLGARP